MVNPRRELSRRTLALLVLASIALCQLILLSKWDVVQGRSEARACLEYGESTEYLVLSTRFSNASAPLLVLHTMHGLSNRLRALASAMAVADATGRQLQVIWEPDNHIQAKFSDLFDNDMIVWESLDAVTGRKDWPSFDKYNYMENEEGSVKYKYIDDTSPNHIYVKTAYLLNSTYSNQEVVSEEFNTLVPSRGVRRHLDPFRSCACRGWAPCMSYIGVHVRNVDPHAEFKKNDEKIYTQEAWKTTSEWRKMSGPDHFVSELRRILREKKHLNIFVSTDSQESLLPFIREFGSQVLYVDKHGCFDRSPKCIKLALADLLLLAYSSHDYILGSFWSSFTEVATYPRSLKVKYAGVDFISPGKHPLKCGAPKLDSTGAFSGVAIVAAAQDRQEMLQETVPAWLSEDSVYEVILVDWNSSPPLREALSFINDTRLRIVEVHGVTSWILTRAFNIGMRHSSAKHILKMDADTMIYPGVIEAHPLERGTFYAGDWKKAENENDRHLNGIFYVHRDDLERANGFDERIETYGWDDEDFYARLNDMGLKRRDLDLTYFHHVEHLDSKRMQYSKSVSKFTDVEMLRNKYMGEPLPVWGPDSNITRLSCKVGADWTCKCGIDSMPMGLDEYHSEESVRNLTLDAYRKVVGYTGDFKDAQLGKVTSLQWYEAYLRRHFHTKDQWIVLKPKGTFAERLLGIQCTLDLAATWERKVQIVWKADKECPQPFEELFQSKSFDLTTDFFDFENNWKYKAVYLDKGTDWLSTTSPPPPGKNLYVVTQGPFGHCPQQIPEDTWKAWEPTPAAESLRPALDTLPVHPYLFVRLSGNFPQRLFGLASAVQLGQTTSRHIVLLWDAKKLGGLELEDVFINQFDSASSIDAYFQTNKGQQAPVYTHNETGSVENIDWARKEHILIETQGQIKGTGGSEQDFNTMIRKLVPTQGMIDEMYGLQVGKNFHGFVVGNNWDSCGKARAFAGLKAEYSQQDLPEESYLLLMAESEDVCDEAGEGVICISMCTENAPKPCFMRQVAATFVMAELPYFFFLDWRHKEVEFILRRGGQVYNKKVECAQSGEGIPANATLVGHLGARKLARAAEATKDECKGKWNLLVQIPMVDGVDAETVERNLEYWDTLHKNMAHPEVKKIFLFTENEKDKDIITATTTKLGDKCSKINFVHLGRRLGYNDTFEFANKLLANEPCAVMNSDMYLGEGFHNLDTSVHLPSNRVLALSRWEKEEGERCGYSICNRYKNAVDGYLSHDTFLFKPPLPWELVSRTDFHQDIGSENVLIYVMKELNMDVRNPCRSLKTYHNHCSGVRRWRTNVTVDSWKSANENVRLDMKLCGEIHCGTGWVKEGPEVLEDLEYD